MSFWILLQVVMDLVLVAGVVGVWMRLKRPPQDDPRLSKGLQLLQTKISVIEDLSDRTENQVNQVTALMESKIKEVQNLIIEADKMLQKIEASSQRSIEVAKIFQDRIPHQEIVERQNTIKYVKAARMAHQGASVDEIAEEVDLPRGEIEFIAKVNRNQLQFSEENLPEWAKQEAGVAATTPEAPAMTVSAAPVAPQPLPKKEDQVTLSALGDRFRKAIQETATAQPKPQPPQNPSFVAQNSKGQEVEVRKVLFPRMDTGSGSR